MSAGRPPTYENAEELQHRIDEWLEFIKGEKGLKVEGQEVQEWKREPEPLTITGLAYYLGFESRQSFYDYEKRPEFSYTVKKARLFVENFYEKRLTGQNVAGSIFALKNMGWADKTELTGANGENLFPGKVIIQQISGLPEIKESEDV